jgi:hypothetical protein
VPALAAAAPLPPGAGAVTVSGLSPATKSFVMAQTGGYYGTNCQYGSRCNNGCGSIHSDLGFMFGPCKSFMDPCGPGMLGTGFCGKCISPIQGRGGMNGPFNPCKYDSNANH